MTFSLHLLPLCYLHTRLFRSTRLFGNSQTSMATLVSFRIFNIFQFNERFKEPKLKILAVVRIWVRYGLPQYTISLIQKFESSFFSMPNFLYSKRRNFGIKELDGGLIFRSCPVLAALLGNSVPQLQSSSPNANFFKRGCFTARFLVLSRLKPNVKQLMISQQLPLCSSMYSVLVLGAAQATERTLARIHSWAKL